MMIDGGEVLARPVAAWKPIDGWAVTALRNYPTVAVEKSRLRCAGLNRHEVEDARALRERSSDPLGLESYAATV